MHARLQLYIWMAVLVLLGLGLTGYKHFVLGFPLIPGKEQTVWTVESKIEFEALGGPVKVLLNLPNDTENLIVIESGAASPGFGFHRTKEGALETRGVWTARERKGSQNLYYQTKVYRGKGTPYLEPEEKPAKPAKPIFRELTATAADVILEDAYIRSADPETLAVRLIELLNAKELDENIATLMQGVEGRAERNQLLLDLLHSAEVPARLLRGIELTEAGRRQKLKELIEVYRGDRWVVVDPASGELGMSKTFLPWQRGSDWLLQVEGGENSKVGFSVNADERAARSVAVYLGREQHSGLVDFSIFTLPVDVQNTFALLLLIPIGALVVVILRNLVGIRTSGTFMPILIALDLPADRPADRARGVHSCWWSAPGCWCAAT